MVPPLILASASPFRRAMLTSAGVEFGWERPAIDERAVEAPLAGSGTTPDEVALILATAKAADVSGRNAEALVIGSDQTLSLGDEVLHKAADMEGARRQLLRLAGRTHQLNSAVAILRNGETLWSHVGIARLTMRTLTPAQVGRYLARVGEKVLASVGCYQIEGEGIRLFENIEGDHFTIVGLPLLPLLRSLRNLGALDD